MNDYKDKYSVSSDNTLREKQYEIKKTYLNICK